MSRLALYSDYMRTVGAKLAKLNLSGMALVLAGILLLGQFALQQLVFASRREYSLYWRPFYWPVFLLATIVPISAPISIGIAFLLSVRAR